MKPSKSAPQAKRRKTSPRATGMEWMDPEGDSTEVERRRSRSHRRERCLDLVALLSDRLAADEAQQVQR